MKTLQHAYWLLAGFVLFAAASGCSEQALSKPSADTKIADSLINVGGKYIWDSKTRVYRFTEKIKLDQIVSSVSPQHALPILVACMDNQSPTQTTLNDKPVVLGILCYQALTQLVYFEPTEAGGDVAKSWPGHILPGASESEMRAAKKAWQQVLDNKTYIFL